jgi:hypothetical protein
VKARTRAMKKARGMALVAGHLKPTIKTKIATIGSEAISARIPVDIMSSFGCCMKINIIF